MGLSRQDWVIAGVLVAIALLVGALLDAIGLLLFIAALVWILLQQREFIALERWSRRPLGRPGNALHSWQGVSERMYRSIQRARARTTRALSTLDALRDITNALPDAAVIVDRAGCIESFNAAAERLLNLKARDVGANLGSLVRQPDFVALLKNADVQNIVEFASPFDEARRMEVRRVRLSRTHALILARDVTQLNRLLTMRQDFVANVSHELRTPLTVVVGYLETMADEGLDIDTMRQLLKKLQSPTDRMRALVDDLLLLTRLEAGALPERRDLVPLDMGALIRSCVAEAKVLSEGRHRFQIDADRGLALLGIESEIYSACLNMVTNAVRYSPGGGCIKVAWRAAGAGAQLSVADQGIGIAKEYQQRITERFYRVDLANSRVRGGTGLGLAIVKHVLKRHNGQLKVDSEPGKGSTFVCEFPGSQLELLSTQPQETTQEFQ